jgi:hypothetical protein
MNSIQTFSNLALPGLTNRLFTMHVTFPLKMKSGVLTKVIYILVLILFFLLVFRHERKPVNNELMVADTSKVIAKMPYYYQFLVTMKKNGYTFYDFRTFENTDTSKLPKKLLVIRHDIHYRDIDWAYDAYNIERLVIGPKHSTFYVMLNNPLELANTSIYNETKYMKFIKDFKKYHVDIQPHISPIDMYIAKKKPYWKDFPLDTLKKMFAQNYRVETSKTGEKIVITGKDVFNLVDINVTLLTLLPEYNAQWTKQTRLKVQGYSAHGSATPMNRVINNANILDQFVLLKSGVYQYDDYNSKIFNILKYLSDNTLPPWMTNPGSIAPGRYEFLMHPYQWNVINKTLP